MATLDATYRTRAALLEGWQFDCAAFGIEPGSYTAADLTHWLALGTTARALAAAGLAGPSRLIRGRPRAVPGDTRGRATARADPHAIRWPYDRSGLPPSVTPDVD